MPVLFSRSCEYATQAVLLLARAPQGKPVLLREISASLGIPHHFLNKVLQLLTRDGVVVSHKGTRGGFTLGRSPEEIRLSEITRAVDGESFLGGCVLGFPSCSDEVPCPVHSEWQRAKDITLNMLNEKTVAALSKNLGDKLKMIEQCKKKSW